MLLLFMIVGGFVALIGGGDLLVRGASKLALAAKVSPLVIGLTVVAFGTSAPELGVSIQSCYSGATELAVGNAVGSNIANVLFVLGASAIAAPLAVNNRLFRLDIPVMIAAAAALWLLGLDGELSRIEGIGLSLALVAYFVATVRLGRREQKQLEQELTDLTDEAPVGAAGLTLAGVQVVGGLVLLVGGANFLVAGCVELALMFGASQLAVGIVVTALGTSLPELVTSFTAALKGQRDLAVGNVVGSNILNILAVLGISSAVSPTAIPLGPDAIGFHLPIMFAISVCCLPVFFTGSSIARWEGLAMLAYYLIYIAYVGVTASSSDGGKAPAPELATTAIFIAPLLVLGVVSLFAAKHES